MADHLVHGVTGLRPYRCLECWERFWRQPSANAPATRPMPVLHTEPSLEQITEIVHQSLRPSGEVLANDNAGDEQRDQPAPDAKKSGSNAA